MTVKQLIKILSTKCSPDAEVSIADENGDFVNGIEFIEFSTTDNTVLLYSSEPNWEECHESIQVKVLAKQTGFAETTYSKLVGE